MNTLSRLFPVNTRCVAVFLTVIVTVVSSGIQTASAQTNVALCDIGLVFKNHPNFSAELESLKRQAGEFQQKTIRIQQQLAQQAEALNQYAPGTEDYKAKESKLASEAAVLEVEQRDVMRKLMQQEATLHYDTYIEVTNVISSYCQTQGIQLVLRYNSEEMDPANPGSIMQQINGSVVYNRNQNDITEAIMREVAGAAANAERR